tara:strand:- start:242 stop:481 length:240 start_codon:yes stop_codon:yes gene_type:complete
MVERVAIHGVHQRMVEHRHNQKVAAQVLYSILVMVIAYLQLLQLAAVLVVFPVVLVDLVDLVVVHRIQDHIMRQVMPED